MQPMTAEKLEQYRELKKEIRMLEDSIKRLTAQTFAPVSDVVRGSMPEYPYIKCVVKITGMDQQTMGRLDRRKIKLAERLEKAHRDVEEIEAWVETIQDSHIRQLVQYRYLEGKSWASVANRIGYKGESGARMALERYFREN